MTTTPTPRPAAEHALGEDDRSAATRTVEFLTVLQPPSLTDLLFGPHLESLIAAGGIPVGEVFTELATPDARAALRIAEVVITGWGTPVITDADLDAAPRLRAILHAGGQASVLLPASVAERGIQVANAGWANGIPVAEYTVAMVVLANKSAFAARALYRDRRGQIDRELEFGTAGNFNRTVGVVGASRIGRMVIGRLRAFDLRVLLYDPYVSEDEAAGLGVELAALDELMAKSDVVTLHPPLNVRTAGMITRELLATMPDGATLINTSRGLIIDQEALIAELKTGRINAIVDVTSPDVLSPENPLYDLPNVFLTPHIAGSMGHELRRMGDQISYELQRVARGEPLQFPEKVR